jgi:hypothetical protein
VCSSDLTSRFGLDNIPEQSGVQEFLVAPSSRSMSIYPNSLGIFLLPPSSIASPSKRNKGNNYDYSAYEQSYVKEYTLPSTLKLASKTFPSLTFTMPSVNSLSYPSQKAPSSYSPKNSSPSNLSPYSPKSPSSNYPSLMLFDISHQFPSKNLPNFLFESKKSKRKKIFIDNYSWFPWEFPVMEPKEILAKGWF